MAAEPAAGRISDRARGASARRDGRTAPAEPTLNAGRIQAPVQVDGLLDEAAWGAAEPATGFRQREPLEGEPATEATEVRVLYDDANLYVGVRALDREPERVIARVLQRDRILQAGLDAQAVWAATTSSAERCPTCSIEAQT